MWAISRLHRNLECLNGGVLTALVQKKKDIINMTKHAYHQTRQIEQNYSPLEIKQ